MEDDSEARTWKPPQETDPAPVPTVSDSYQRPVIIDLGSVREVTRGSVSSGNADGTSQYYP